MNRFKSKKKGAKEEVFDPRPSLESESSFSLFRRGKKNQEPEEKKEIDLTSALPSTDDFRTSLLMSGLSARFSMLREQDDPKSKLGKASDDSVLFPNRQSRLADFGFANGAGLGDIAEVESIKAPSFLRRDTTASNDSGSVMTRSRPLESNVMFGGRQKVYKIAAGSSSTRNLDGMSGRALYDDDVAMSSFQKWRQAEKDRGIWTEIGDNDDGNDMKATEDNSFMTRSDSPPPHGYDRKRETSSTTSSTPSGGRNSTAATSIVSQPTPASKEGHPIQTSASSASSTPALDRHNTRTRRLYEQGLNQDLQEQQHSVLSRVDTLTRRPGGARTPDIGPNSPSPTMTTFTDRWAGFSNDRRTVLSKGSAPNLRSMSPPATGSLNGTMELNTRLPNAADAKAGFFSPPLSPPISDAGTGEQVNLHIQAKDHGKATAMNMFQKPNSTYDDSKYAERQRQLQQGRDTPTQRFREDSIFSAPKSRSGSAASIQRRDSNFKAADHSVSKQVDLAGQQDSASTNFFIEPLESPILNEHIFSSPHSPQVRLERPSDQDHPAFRSVNPPLAFPLKADEQQSADASLLAISPKAGMLADSPTLGPTGGLSGMVRQHLRSESDVSSIYAPQSDVQFSPRRLDDIPVPRKAEEEIVVEPSALRSKPSMPRLEEDSTLAFPETQGSSLESSRSPDEEDEFASQLANARRRVREKLTSFVETDASYFSPPLMADPAADLPAPPSRSNPLGILRGKDSLGSLIDRGRDATPKLARDNSAVHDTEAQLNDEEDAHPSLKAFRQARREMQRRKEHESGTRQATQPQNGQFSSPLMDRHMPMVDSGRREPRHAPSRERFQGEPGSASEVPAPPPRSGSRIARDRSGSEDSDGSGRSRSRPSQRSPNDGRQPMPSEMLSAAAPRKNTARSPGLPGTDVRRSPVVPPNGAFQNGLRLAAQHGESIATSTSLKGLPGRSLTEPASAGQSVASSRGGRFEPPRAAPPPNGVMRSGSSTPTIPPSRRPSNAPQPQTSANSSTLTDSMKRVVNKKDISEPTFLMSTSRVPTTNLPQSATDAREARSRSGSIADAGSPPPVPPVNPRRKRDSSRTRTLMNGFMGGRRGDESDKAMQHSMSTPQLPLDPPPLAPFAQSHNEDRNSAFSISDDEDEKPNRSKLRKAASELRMDTRAGFTSSRRVSPPQVAVGPPAGRVVMARGSSPNMPGGMF